MPSPAFLPICADVFVQIEHWLDAKEGLIQRINSAKNAPIMTEIRI